MRYARTAQTELSVGQCTITRTIWKITAVLYSSLAKELQVYI